MKITIALTTLLSIFATVPTFAWVAEDPVPDLCTEDVYLDLEGVPLVDSDGTTLSRYCVWTGEDAPVWAGEVCCELGAESAYCTPTDALGECSAVQLKRWCDYAKFDGAQVKCLQPFPSACEAGICIAPPPGTALESQVPMCCVAGGCYEISMAQPCDGDFLICLSPYTNENGSIGCAD